ncbi:hypothetical protein WJX84_005432 [Apatococcus fuscideae]|uniref:Calmodulin n=1 Tax=Apatococcus fuscideae TaxID=2026836 RepID=A0AAW1SDG4_9CHLO
MTTERHKAQVPTGPSLLYHSSDKLQHLQLRVSLRRLGGGFIDRQQQSPGRLAADYDSGDDSSDVGSIDALERAAASISRLFSWQEKVYSYAESKAGQAGGQEGSRVFTYVDQDEACQDFEAGQAATTLPGDAASPLYQKVLRERSWNDKGYTSMLLMMDASDFDGGSLDQHVLAHIRAYADGSFHMRPGFSQPGDPHRFEDDMGRIYEYDLHNAADAELHPRPTTRQLLKDLTAAQRAKVQGCDRQGRLRTEGYGWISLATVSLGMQELHVSTWRPVQPSAASTLRSVFQGGAPALMDITNVKHPRSMHPAVSTKYGLQARTSGTIQVKSCMLAQQRARSSSDPISMPLMQDQSNMQATLSRAKQRLQVVNDLGSVMSEEALVAVLPLQPPSPDPAPESHLVPETHAEPPATPHPPEILSHPRGLDVTAGDLVELAVEVIGDSPIEYTWTRDREVLTGQSGPVLIILESAPLDSGQYMCQARNAAGHASSLPAFVVVRDAPMPLRIIQQPRLRDAGSYVCTVSNAEGRITSEAASVSVEARLPDLEWIVQPKPQDLEAGADLHLEAVASGHAPLHYQWLCDGRPLQGWELNDITIPAVTPGDQGQYACQVKDGRGQVSTSQLAPVRVSERPLPPSIARHPEDATLSEGSQLHLVTSAEGSQPLTFTWFHAGQGLDGFSTSDLIIEPVGLHHAGGYSCRVSNAAGQAMSDEAWVTVEQMPAAGPVILQRPASMQVAHGQRFMISVVAEGAEPLLYSWTYNGALLDGQTDSELVVPIALKASHQGLYKAKVQNAVGEAESEDAYILVEAVDIFGMIERHLETKRMTLKSLFMQFLRSQDGVMRGQQVAAMIRHVYPNVTPAELRHFEVMVDSDGSGTMSFKELAIALKEAKAGGAYVEGATSLQTLLTQLSLRMQDQGHNFRKIWAQFDTDGDGELSYYQLLQLLHRQLPQLERSEMRQLLGYLHEIDIDGNGYLSYGELWTAIQRAPVLGQARRDMRRIAGLARTPAEKDDALRRAHTHKRTFSLKQDEFSEVVLGHAHTSLF